MNIKNIIKVSKKDNIENIIKSLKKKGFYKFQSSLNDQAIKFTEAFISNYAKKKIKQGTANSFDPDAINITALHLKNDYFYNYIFNKFILKICKKYFEDGAHKFSKNNFQFDTINTRVLKKKTKAQKLHIDSRVCGIYPPIRMQFLFYLEDVTNKDSGATHVIPGSHKFNRYPTQRDVKNAIKILGKKGTFFVIDSSIWHGSSKKNNNDKRTLIAMAYNRWIIRQAFATPYAIKNSKKLNFNLEQKYILGYFNYADKSGSRPKVPISKRAIARASSFAKGSRKYDETVI